MAFPDRQRATLTYVDNNRLTNGVNTFAVQTWSLNSAFDPDVTGAGHQPRFFDTYAGIYARYVVTGVHVRVCVRQRAAHGLGVVFLPTNGAPTLNPAGYPQEYRRASPVRITSSNQPPVEFDVHIDPASIAGVSHATYMADDRFQSGVATSPTEIINGSFFVYNLDGATAVDAEYSATLKYDVEFYDLAVPGPSLSEDEVAAQRWTEVTSAEVRGPPGSLGGQEGGVCRPVQQGGRGSALTSGGPTPLQRFLSTRNSEL
jgi:hypothetical protein